MPDYSIGDRVEVRWEAELFDATVTKVNVIDGNATSSATTLWSYKTGGVVVSSPVLSSDGTLLHGGGSKKVCKEKGCTTRAVARGVCTKHGANGRCKYAGCTTNATSGSKHCRKHGGGKNKPCSVAGCTTNSKRKGLCGKHGGGPGECVFGGCTNKMVSTWWKTCTTHGGKGYCKCTDRGAIFC